MAQISIEDVLDSPAIPTLPTIAVELLRLTRDPNVSLEQIERLVMTDPGLAARVLRTVNSSLFGLKSRCTTIRRAVTYLGLNGVKSILLGFSLVDVAEILHDEPVFDVQAYWRRLIYGSAAARHFAVRAGTCDPDETFTCAMFQDMGMIAMLVTLGDRYLDLLIRCGDDHESLVALERQAFGFDHCQAGAGLAGRWHMTDLVSTLILRHHDPSRVPSGMQTIAHCVVCGRYAVTALFTTDPAGDIPRFNDAMGRWFNIPATELTDVLETIAGAGRELAGVLEQPTGPAPRIEQILAEANRQLVGHQITLNTQLAASQQREQELADRAETDALTGAGNRARFDTELAHHFAAYRSDATPLAIIFTDADRFKQLNDTHGHQAGDRVLQILADRIRGVVQARGIVCRYGGEEFAVLLPGLDRADVLRMAESIRRAAAETPFDMRDVPGVLAPSLSATLSVGVAIADAASTGFASPESLLRAADAAAYDAKETGRNRVRVHGDAGDPHSAVAGATDAGAHATSEAISAILVIDDDALATTLLSAVMARVTGCPIERYTSVASASRRLAEFEHAGQHPQLVLCDLGLPDGSGLEILSRMRDSALLSGTPILVVTGNDDPALIERCRKGGATAVFRKEQICGNLALWTKQVVDRYLKKPAAA
ncbi:MAG: HDOD domain-containing protein [Phycisphaeraceae bacterium]|nr:HDOD domain-containing protein [Phycisphaeraceae bacterium]